MLKVTRRMQKCLEPLTEELLDAMAENRAVFEGRNLARARPTTHELFRAFRTGERIALGGGKVGWIVLNSSSAVVVQTLTGRVTLSWAEVAERLSKEEVVK